MSFDKKLKYDRQLRLWANTGQTSLEASHICLINATAVGSEILKNLILPGIGEYTIIDNRKVTEEHIFGNFFLDEEDIGNNIASSLAKQLNELNTDVKGHAVNTELSELLRGPASFWDKFNTVVVTNQVTSQELDVLLDILWERRIPVFLVRTVGFYGTLQLFAKEINVVETHDPAMFHDLRIINPWSELQEYSDTMDIDALDDEMHAHVPYVIILLKALEKWKKENGGKLPLEYSKRSEFKRLVESMSRNLEMEDNFKEAAKATHRALQFSQFPPLINDLFQKVDSQEISMDSNIPLFWVYVKALKQFVEKYNELPLPGSLPDMTSTSFAYVTLTKLYAEKAREDERKFTDEVVYLLKASGHSEVDVNHDSIHSFCKNIHFLYATTGSRKLYNNSMISTIMKESNSLECSTLFIYFTLMCYFSFADSLQAFPNPGDLERFKAYFRNMFSLPSSKPLPEGLIEIFKEALAHSSQSYHNISSLMGGVASQEILKVSTAQYTPLDNLYVFDGVHSISEKWKI
ncbi:Piso0_000206 [Millerozyma farinosa CBS 7064]|uniref:NEDD8-activating enzyme E1 regulatory subunit n=1 Tax=Pichia sorbitophila (strain ATCC MYA-4447 / BCRC 22081 / CBS 7064 / NBRC 10061 / NRRL Y-12695) TaxID=559304 RepID=G8YUT6_PICSO|nr:Piso0_000206 [Millerozyma farinosa CBS 7064]